MVLDHPVALGNDSVVLVWISAANAKAVAEKGFSIVHAASDYLYLDCELHVHTIYCRAHVESLAGGHGGWVGDYPAGASWCDPFKSWQAIYAFDPFANITASQQHFVKGGTLEIFATRHRLDTDIRLPGETLLWTEQADSTSLDTYVWPRAAAAGEVFWTGAATSAGPRDGAEALPRLHDWR